ncbi:hypothetical protein BO70DRAFT_396460 [Aspergillus heteromorphus CBS 117.55]|uniref:Uncharacterized protein n=1 Tax=Aspergillus heteromorphus CBS 117.55 TaxID=1448321 RepID=A0A317WA10_9EURO|nr:uncharacterized protein BO70DRAFT_396460 [Aspergillus heteromorphus CBS 117.55]PWY82162.1 hypothetical protein BO70DRAFT_396460 [Aspergillus heteromorphus CBS 117.55]
MRSVYTFLAAALSLAPAARSYTLEGHGALVVSDITGSDILGYLNTDGKWADEDPVAFNGGSTLMFNGQYKWLIVNDQGTITTDEHGPDGTYWEALTHNRAGEPTFIIATDLSGEGVYGGPFWYASAVPVGSEAVALSSEPFDGAQNVTLTWFGLI